MSSESKPRVASPSLSSTVRSVHFLWYVGHVLALIGGFNYSLFSLRIFRSSRFPFIWYRESYVATLLTFAIIIQQTHFKSAGAGRKPVDVKSLIKDDNVHYMLLALLWLFTKPFFLSLPPFMIFSLFHVIGFTRSNMLPALGYSVSSPLYRGLDNFYRSYNGPSLMVAAGVEVINFFSFLFKALTMRRDALIPFVFYALFIKVRYEQSNFTRNVFHAYEIKIDSLVANPRVPLPIKRGWVGFKQVVRKYIGQVSLVGVRGVKKTQ